MNAVYLIGFPRKLKNKTRKPLRRGSNVCSFRYGLPLARLRERSSTQSRTPPTPATALKVSRGTHHSLSWTIAQPAGAGACAPVAKPRSFWPPAWIRSTASVARRTTGKSQRSGMASLHPPRPQAGRLGAGSGRPTRPASSAFRPYTSRNATQWNLAYLNCRKEGALQFGAEVSASRALWDLPALTGLWVPARGRSIGQSWERLRSAKVLHKSILPANFFRAPVRAEARCRERKNALSLPPGSLTVW